MASTHDDSHRPDISNLTAKHRLQALNELDGSYGFAIFVKRWREQVGKEIDKVVYDPKTSDDERRNLVHARKYLVENFDPGKLVNSLIAGAKTEAAREHK